MQQFESVAATRVWRLRTALSSLAFAVVLALSCSEASDVATLALETPSPATRGAALAENVGIETAAGEFTPILESGCSLPCEETATFGTFEDDQPEILLYLFRGEGSETANAHDLGVVEIAGYPPGPAGELEVRVTFRAGREGLSLSARAKSGVAFELRRAEAEGGS